LINSFQDFAVDREVVNDALMSSDKLKFRTNRNCYLEEI